MAEDGGFAFCFTLTYVRVRKISSSFATAHLSQIAKNVLDARFFNAICPHGFESHARAIVVIYKIVRNQKTWRRMGDSNPRYRGNGKTVFETAAFNRSANPPYSILLQPYAFGVRFWKYYS